MPPTQKPLLPLLCRCVPSHPSFAAAQLIENLRNPRGPPDHGSGRRRRIAPRQRADRRCAGAPSASALSPPPRLRPTPNPRLKKTRPRLLLGALLYWSLASRLCAIALARACALGSPARPAAPPFVFTGSSLRPESFPSSRSAAAVAPPPPPPTRPPASVLARVQRVGADQYSTVLRGDGRLRCDRGSAVGPRRFSLPSDRGAGRRQAGRAMGRLRGGGGCCCCGGGGCALLAAALVVSALVIHGGGGLKQSHAPAVARKVLLSITSWHPQNNLDNVLHPSPVQDQRFERVGTVVLPVSTASPPISIGQRMKRQAASIETAVHPANQGNNHGIPVAAPSKGGHHHSMPVNNTHGKTHGPPVVVPAKRKHHHAPANGEGPGISPSKPPIVHRKRHGNPVVAPPKEHSSHLPSPNRRHNKGHGNSDLHHSPAPAPAPVHLPLSKGRGQGSSAYAPHHPHQYHSPSYSPGPSQPPVHPPETPVFKKPNALAPTPNQPLLSPPTNSYCTASCQDPLTNSPPGTTCLCVLPIKVELRFGIALYTFFTLVAELAQDIASGVLMNQSQVRVMGANAAPDDPEKTIVFIDLVPLESKFDNTTALLVFERFWHNKVIINPMHFGKYDVLYVQYEGLPPSPPASMNNGLSNANGQPLHPLAVDVGNHREKRKGRGIIVIIILSSVFAFILCAGAALVVYFKLRNHSHLTEASLVPTKPAGPGSAMAGNRLESRPISASPSFSSSLVAYKGSAKAFSLVEMERATQVFDESRIIGEGGFGRVYEGIFEDGERVAIKVLKRDDQQGTREFLAEVEMLSRLHHRNLVKLIGICTEGHSRCLVYELVPNGSVESHLHGSDKGASRLDWDARLKIALGAARALAYLHEDSSPRVIHRDFKSSNILLEHDFTPKVSDFGLARTALGEGNEHISTRVMGTFGYVAPEYAMTGHLLVKSDVYSYGVVLLELLTGRKPVDMSRPPGQENLVAWASSLLTSRDGLESIIDPSLGRSIPFDSIAKVAAIASMCVQPEVDQRPFMGEVVQALKLVCNEGSEFNGSTSFSQDLHIQDVEIMSRASMDMDVDPALSAELFTSSARYDAIDASGSFRRYSSSGPLRVGRAGHNKERGLSTGSSSEHVGLQRSRIDSE